MLSIVTPFVPRELTEVGYITIFTGDIEMGISPFKLKQFMCSQIVDLVTVFGAIIPKHKGTVGIFHVLPTVPLCFGNIAPNAVLKSTI